MGQDEVWEPKGYMRALCLGEDVKKTVPADTMPATPGMPGLSMILVEEEAGKSIAFLHACSAMENVNVNVVSNSVDALQQLKDRSVHVVLMGLDTPQVIDAFDTTRWILEHSFSSPPPLVIAATAMSCTPGVMYQAAKAGMRGVLSLSLMDHIPEFIRQLQIGCGVYQDNGLGCVDAPPPQRPPEPSTNNIWDGPELLNDLVSGSMNSGGLPDSAGLL